MHATLMHCDRKPLSFYRTAQAGQVLTFSYSLSISTVFSIHTPAYSPHQETPTSPSLQYSYHFLHSQQTLNSFIEHHMDVGELRRKCSELKQLSFLLKFWKAAVVAPGWEDMPPSSIGRTTPPLLWQPWKQLFISSPWELQMWKKPWAIWEHLLIK